MLMLLGMAILQAAPLPPETWKERNHPDMPVIPKCNVGKDATIAISIASLPDPIAAELTRFFGAGGLSEANGPYNSTDVSNGNHVPTRRFLRAYHVRDYWIIWYEHGGIVTGQTTLALTSDSERRHGERPYRVTPGTALAGNLCIATKALIAGVRTSNP